MENNYYRKSKSVTKFIWIFTVFSLMFTGCSKDDDPQPQVNVPDPQPEEQEELPPLALACDYFDEDRVLTDDPLRPVDYVIDCYMVINDATSINIEPGVVIAFEEDAGMRIDGDTQFEATGSSDKPIIFTGTSATKGHWRGLFFISSEANNKLEHAIVEYAGGMALSPNSPVYEGSIAVRNSAAIAFNYVEVSNGGNYGMDLTGSSAIVSASNMTITGNEGVPVKIAAYHAHIFDNTSKFAGNSEDYVNIVSPSSSYEIEDQDVTWTKLDVPYLVDGRVHIKHGGHLTIGEGVEIFFEPEAYLQASDGSTDGGNILSLKIVGTATNPVHLQAANGTNWGGIYYGFTKENNSITHALIEHATGDFPVGNLTNSGAIYMHANPHLTVSSTTFNDVPNYAFYAYTGASEIEPDLPNLIRSGITYTNVVKGSLGWGDGSTDHYPTP